MSLRQAEDASPPVPVEEIERLIEERQAARRRRDFAAADGIRRQLADRACCSKTTRGARAGKEMSTMTSPTTVPYVKTALPGPRAKAIIERDGRVVSPSTRAITRS